MTGDLCVVGGRGRSAAVVCDGGGGVCGGGGDRIDVEGEAV